MGRRHPREENKDRNAQVGIALQYERIEYSEEEIDHARGVVAASSLDADDAREILEHLGLMPNQTTWYEKKET